MEHNLELLLYERRRVAAVVVVIVTIIIVGVVLTIQLVAVRTICNIIPQHT